MEYRTLGQGDLRVSVITFGAWAIGGWMWGGADMKAAIGAIHAGLDHGMTSIDTAPIYGYGLSEQIVGEALKGKQRDKILILTKFGLRWDYRYGDLHMKDVDENGKEIGVYKCATRDSIIHECEQSLKRLRTDYIDLFQIHWPDTKTPIAETMEALAALKQQGKIREAGVCNYSTDQMQEAEQTISLSSNQVPYSMVNRGIETDLVPYCAAHHRSILAYSPMQRGLLTGKFSPDHVFKVGDSRPRTRYFSRESITRVNTFLEKIKPIAEDHQAPLSQVVLRWTIDQPGITIALAGARDALQAIENARAADLKLSQEELDLIGKELRKLELA